MLFCISESPKLPFFIFFAVAEVAFFLAHNCSLRFLQAHWDLKTAKMAQKKRVKDDKLCCIKEHFDIVSVIWL